MSLSITSHNPTDMSRAAAQILKRGAGTLAVVALLAAVWFGTRKAYRWWAYTTSGSLVCADPIFDFGVQSPGTRISHAFVLQNHGPRPIKVLSMKTDCSCSVAEFDRSQPIPPNGSREVPVAVNTTGNYGPTARHVIVTTDVPNSEPLRLRIQGNLELPWLPPEKDLRFEYPRDPAQRAALHSKIQLEARAGVPQLALRPKADSLPAYLNVEVTPSGGRVFDVAVTLAPSAPEQFSQEIVLETPGVKYPPYRFTVRGGVRQDFAAYPPKLLIDGRAGETVRREVRIRSRDSSRWREAPVKSINVTPEVANPAVTARSELRGGEVVVLVDVSFSVSPPPPSEGRATIRLEHDSAGQVTEIPLIYFLHDEIRPPA